MSTQVLSPACQPQLLLLQLSQDTLGLLHLVDLGACTVQHKPYSETEEIGSLHYFTPLHTYHLLPKCGNVTLSPSVFLDCSHNMALSVPCHVSSLSGPAREAPF